MQKAQTFIDNARETVICWQREMTARPALGPENGGQGEAEKSAWLLAELRRMGIEDIQTYPAPDSRVPGGVRPNICARIPGKSARTLWVVGHMDVVPPGDLQLWHTPPYELQVDGDHVIGRGVEDNQQAIVTGMLVAKALLERNIVPELGLGLLLVSDEETGMTHGLPHVLDAAPGLIAADDIVLVPDFGNAQGDFVEVAEKSVLWLRVTVTGRQCHASRPNDGLNSLVVASEAILALQKLYRIFPDNDPLFHPAWSTFVPSKKEANVENINTMPGKDVFYVDCRVLPSCSLEDVERECRRLLQAVARRTGADIKVEVVHAAPSLGRTDPSSPQVQRLLRALKEVRGIEGRASGSGGQTVAVVLRNRQLPAVVWSTILLNPHTPNERSSISNTIFDARVVLAMLFD